MKLTFIFFVGAAFSQLIHQQGEYGDENRVEYCDYSNWCFTRACPTDPYYTQGLEFLPGEG